MIRGTTPVHLFDLPFDTEVIDKVRIVYAQDGDVIFTRDEGSCEFEGNVIKVHLSQEETLKFDDQKTVQIQVTVKTVYGKVLKTEVLKVTAGKCLEDEVI